MKMHLGGAGNQSPGKVLCSLQEDRNGLRRSDLGGSGTVAFKNLSRLGRSVAKGRGGWPVDAISAIADAAMYRLHVRVG